MYEHLVVLRNDGDLGCGNKTCKQRATESAKQEIAQESVPTGGAITTCDPECLSEYQVLLFTNNNTKSIPGLNCQPTGTDSSEGKCHQRLYLAMLESGTGVVENIKRIFNSVSTASGTSFYDSINSILTSSQDDSQLREHLSGEDSPLKTTSNDSKPFLSQQLVANVMDKMANEGRAIWRPGFKAVAQDKTALFCYSLLDHLVETLFNITSNQGYDGRFYEGVLDDNRNTDNAWVHSNIAIVDISVCPAEKLMTMNPGGSPLEVWGFVKGIADGGGAISNPPNNTEHLEKVSSEYVPLDKATQLVTGMEKSILGDIQTTLESGKFTNAHSSSMKALARLDASAAADASHQLELATLDDKKLQHLGEVYKILKQQSNKLQNSAKEVNEQLESQITYDTEELTRAQARIKSLETRIKKARDQIGINDNCAKQAQNTVLNKIKLVTLYNLIDDPQTTGPESSPGILLASKNNQVQEGSTGSPISVVANMLNNSESLTDVMDLQKTDELLQEIDDTCRDVLNKPDGMGETPLCQEPRGSDENLITSTDLIPAPTTGQMGGGEEWKCLDSLEVTKFGECLPTMCSELSAYLLDTSGKKTTFNKERIQEITGKINDIQAKLDCPKGKQCFEPKGKTMVDIVQEIDLPSLRNLAVQQETPGGPIPSQYSSSLGTFDAEAAEQWHQQHPDDSNATSDSDSSVDDDGLVNIADQGDPGEIPPHNAENCTRALGITNQGQLQGMLKQGVDKYYRKTTATRDDGKKVRLPFQYHPDKVSDNYSSDSPFHETSNAQRRFQFRQKCVDDRDKWSSETDSVNLNSPQHHAATDAWFHGRNYLQPSDNQSIPQGLRQDIINPGANVEVPRPVPRPPTPSTNQPMALLDSSSTDQDEPETAPLKPIFGGRHRSKSRNRAKTDRQYYRNNAKMNSQTKRNNPYLFQD